MCYLSEVSIQLTITELARSGAGIAKLEDGRTAFVPYTAPGDVVMVEIKEEVGRRFVEAWVTSFIHESPDRVKPPCSVFGRCGGCMWQHLPYALQWKTKKNGALHALKRTQALGPDFEAALAAIPIDEFPAENPYGYRNRIQMRGYWKGDRPIMGFFERGTRNLVPISRCEISDPAINAAFGSTLKQVPKQAGEFKVELEVDRLGTVRKSWNARHAALGFRQVNDLQNDRLKSYVSQQIDDWVRVWDLFGGNGNLSTDLIPRVDSVDCVDTSVPLATPPELPETFRFHRSEVLPWAFAQLRNRSRDRTVEASPLQVIVDPPRDGLGPATVKLATDVESCGGKKWIAVGCDPDSWAADLTRLTGRGWRVTRIGIFDLFPQTPHVESVAVLRR